MNILLFFIPPVVGAVIGFVTNAVAIKMLFRPLKEIRFFGIRLPFTPGILPRQRGRLAQSIGGMVERELLTPEILCKKLMQEDTQEQIRLALSHFTENLLNKRPYEILVDNEKILESGVKSAAEKVYPSLILQFVKFLNREEIRRELESKGIILLNRIFLQLNTFQRLFLSAGQYDLTLQEKIPGIISDLILSAEDFLNNDKIKNKLIEAITNSFSQIISGQDKRISELLNIDNNKKNKLDDYIFNKLISGIDEKIENILYFINVKTLVSNRIDSLDMLRVERIILDVMADQFKWINIFGAILGFFIGAFQVLINFVIR